MWRYLPWVLLVAFLVGLVGRTAVFAGRGMVAAGEWDGQKQWVAGKVIVLDPGHGGDDPGVVVGAIREKEITLPVALKTKEILEAQGARVILTRDSDIDLGGKIAEELGKRVQLVTEHGAQLYVSIHANKLNCNCWGAQTFYQRGGTPQGKALAFALQNQLRKWTPTTRTALEANYFVLRTAPVPAALVEVGFLSNGREAANLRDPAYQGLVANAIALGIADYFQQGSQPGSQQGSQQDGALIKKAE
ncbi:MAG TPA: N-acetylmuramoyl-L-alanine amidase [Symbiobacteriaceae bacterium]|nr:N-acetylmuramoyl-L-alanine amidase [Symbiobacteriaceae bacterium]